MARLKFPVKSFLLAACLLCVPTARAQFNIDRMLVSGEVALHYEDYVLSIQYFNQIIALRPHMYQPWHLRGAAKFYLEDFAGAEEDATQAISLNPYVDAIYDLRAIARIRQDKYDEAIADYTKAISLNPAQENYWYNRAICEMHLKNYDTALLQTDTIIRRWSKFANGYALKAELYLNKNDTVEAMNWLKKSIDIDPYDGTTWMTRATINLARSEWAEADSCLTRAIHLRPKHVPSYISRALARINTNNLRGAMSDYDTALDLDPNNFLAHYNRGLLRMQLGADNDAIEDFDYVIEMEPENVLAIFNRGILREKTGDLHGAIRDYTKVINQFPNFWTGLSYRAGCYRKLGYTAQAEKDEFVIYKAQMDKHLGIQPRWSAAKVREMRQRGEIDPDKYSSIVVDDTSDEHEYQSEYRGHVQNRSVSLDNRPLFLISLYPYNNGMKTYQAFDRDVEKFNAKTDVRQKLYVACGNQGLGTVAMTTAFALVDTLTADLYAAKTDVEIRELLMQRAVAYTMVQNYTDAIADLDQVVANDSTMSIAWWQRAVCQTMLNNFNIAQGIDARLKSSMAMEDFNRVLTLAPNNAYVYYDRASLHAEQGNIRDAIEDYTTAIRLEPHLAEAYYNRGLLYYSQGDNASATRDLGKAGELGLYDAYSVMKRMK
ncbi:MAG: tetratricopeptide repeat protein [Prevotella sp.]|nr:tetratricopeptide repeat protein [Prevotella sp.]